MNRTATLLLSFLLAANSFALMGGPDQYGYIWKDSNEPGGPSFSWFDITSFGTQITGLGDDNIVGPFVMQTNMPFYWYDAKKVWIGSNGYVAFNNVNIAAPFPTIPLAGAPNDYLAVLNSDLTFLGSGNTAECWYYDDGTVTVVSWLNLPFWTSIAPSYTGTNSFQVILNKQDSTITMQYLDQTGTGANFDYNIGIESITGDIGLQHSADVLPVSGYAIRYYMPAVPLITVTDASVEWNTDELSRGVTLKRFDPDFVMTMNVRNTGNVDVGGFNAIGAIYNSLGTLVVADTQYIYLLEAGIDTTITFSTTFPLNGQGTYSFQADIIGIPSEFVTSNNTRIQELEIYDGTFTPFTVDWAGSLDDGIGIGWDGGDGGVATYVQPPYYPAYITGTTIRIASNTTPSGFTLKIYDDDGPDGGHGTLLDSVYIAPVDGAMGNHIYPVSAPFFINDGGVYVEWYMQGTFVNIAQDYVGPYSLHSYEVLGSIWAEYRDRDTRDFHLGIQVSSVPVHDVGCTGFFGLIPGLDVSAPTVVRTWVKNFGNQTENNFPVNWSYNGGTVNTQNYSGPALAPGDSALFTFTTPLIPSENSSGNVCAWTNYGGDAENNNDTVCVAIDMVIGIEELHGSAITLVPNPAQDRITIGGLPEGNAELGLFDLSSRLVLHEFIRTRGGAVSVDLSNTAPGTYFCQLRVGDRIFGGKVIVQR